jgi:hypothetical protein
MAMTGTNDDKLIKMVMEAGHQYGPAILATSKREAVPLALALALVEQESDFINQFGCDLGPRSTAPWCHQLVTRDRVQALIRHVEGGGISNGVGLTQLTTIGLIQQAEAEGGAHRVRPQCRVGFRLLHGLIERHGEVDGIGCYNGGEGNPVLSYSKSVRALRDKWQASINHTLLG